jgi:hypothetical protein
VAGDGALRPPEAALRPAQQARVLDPGAVVEDGERRQPQVDPALLVGGRQRRRRHVDHKGHEVPPGGVEPDATAARHGGQGAAPAQPDVPDLRQPDASGGDPEAVAGEAHRLGSALGAVPGRAGAPPTPLGGQAVEEVAVGPVQVVARLDEHHRGHLAQPGALHRALGLRDDPPLHRRVGDERQAGPVRLPPHPEPVVVDHPGAAERLGQGDPLRPGGVRPVVVPELDHVFYCALDLLPVQWPIRRGRHLDSALCARLDCVATCRRGVPARGAGAGCRRGVPAQSPESHPPRPPAPSCRAT